MQLTRASEGRSEPSQGLDLIWGLGLYGATLPDLLLFLSTFICSEWTFIQFYSILNAELVVMHAEIRVASELQASWLKLNLTNGSRSFQIVVAIHNRIKGPLMCKHVVVIFFSFMHTSQIWGWGLLGGPPESDQHWPEKSPPYTVQHILDSDGIA